MNKGTAGAAAAVGLFRRNRERARARMEEGLARTASVKALMRDDLESGAGAPDEGGGGGGVIMREQLVTVRSGSSACAMGAVDRKMLQLQHMIGSVKGLAGLGGDEDDDDDAGGEDDAVVSDQPQRKGGSAGPPDGEPFEQEEGGGGSPPRADAASDKGAAPPSSRGAPGGVQYRLQSKKRVVKGWKQWFSCMFNQNFSEDNEWGFLDFNKWISYYLHWTFRTSFFMLLFSMILCFVALTLFYAGLIMWSGRNKPECIASAAFNDLETYSTKDRFSDAYQLSWSTFSTVGYGIIYPETSAGYARQRHCAGIKILCSLEAFFGVLFSGLCGAILFGKVSRIQSFAQVVFSDPIIVKYGSGVAAENDDDSDEDEDEKDGEEHWKESSSSAPPRRSSGSRRPKKIPCPILEFRIANRLHSTHGGEIIDAALNCVASIDAKHACPDILRSVDPTHVARRSYRFLRSKPGASTEKGGQQKRAKRTVHSASMTSGGAWTSVVGVKNVAGGGLSSIIEGGAAVDVSAGTAVSDGSSLAGNDGGDGAAAVPPEDIGALASSALIDATRTHQAMEEDASDLAPRRIFSKVEIQTSSHPFFKRVWVAKHTLDESSPLLTDKAKRLVRKNGGYWPEELNTYSAIRESIKFNQILVSMSGTCNVNGASVYAQKIYHFVDITVGYQFANTLFRDPNTGALRVDMSLINDVKEQDGDDEGEPFDDVEGEVDENV